MGGHFSDAEACAEGGRIVETMGIGAGPPEVRHGADALRFPNTLLTPLADLPASLLYPAAGGPFLRPPALFGR